MISNEQWPLYKLKDVTTYISRGKQPKYVEKSDIRTLNQKAIQWGNIIEDALKYHNPEVNVPDKHFIQKDDVVINSTGTGTVGRIYHFREKPSYLMFADSHVTIVRTNPEILNARFLTYQLSINSYQEMIISSFLAGSTGQVELNKSKVESLPIYVPDIRIQNAIVNILEKLDSKIEINHQLIINLEQLSQTLFKHWFIDFEFPNEQGQPYKSSGGEMVESELGEIPKGWQTYSLKELSNLLKKSFNPNKSQEEKVVHFSLPAFDNGQIPVLDEVKKIKSNKWTLEENCVAFSKMNPRTPRVWLTNITDNYLNVASSEFVVLKSETSELNSFIYKLCKSNLFTEFLIANATGSTNSRQRVTPTVALQFKIALNLVIVNKYGDTINSMMENIKGLRREMQTLQQLRDTLLPKLLSGEIGIPDELEVK